ncbi:hypothetical protein J2X72_001155 [Phyllobacterium sp. 1468]|uniref:hypothetical protein n=1 Tax=Phyllobacterium sp. 1468 TaxID=2817759 RepID=UPI00285C89F0|nr:hypothetical protein [Phyllobacterium sp. 1468]MDR6632371.1 hypothetical protein [Phyllobacterium sp. 1468]
MTRMTDRELHLHTEAVLRAEVIKRGGSAVLQRWADNFADCAATLHPLPAQLDLFGGAA